MGLRIATNVSALQASRQLGYNTLAQRESLEHLASGSRINKSADDAAGLAVSEKMRGDLRSARQDMRNSNDAISLVQTAEGGLSQVSNILVRFRELAIQAATDTLGDTERGFIDKEVQQLKTEITRITSSTEFNGRKLLNAEGEAYEFQVGIHNKATEDRVVYDVKNIGATLEGLGIANFRLTSKESARENIEVIDHALNNLISNRATLGALQNRLQCVVSNLGVYDENLAQAMSRIKDTDMAYETTEQAKNNILAQAGVSVLSQANQNNLLALKLLG